MKRLRRIVQNRKMIRVGVFRGAEGFDQEAVGGRSGPKNLDSGRFETSVFPDSRKSFALLRLRFYASRSNVVHTHFYTLERLLKRILRTIMSTIMFSAIVGSGHSAFETQFVFDVETILSYFQIGTGKNIKKILRTSRYVRN